MPSALTLSAQRRRNFAIMAGAPAGQSKRSKEWSRALDETLIGLLLERYPSGRVSSSDVGAIPWDAIFASDKFPPHLTAEKMRQRLHDAYAAWLSQAVRSPLAPPRLAGNSAHDALTRSSTGLPHSQARPQSTSPTGAAAGARLQREGRRHLDDSIGQCVTFFVPPPLITRF